MTLALLAGCATGPVSETAICTATHDARQTHAAALVADGGPQSRRTGAALISALDAGCA
ncbi:hypothetical protein [Paracoccus sp. (in: a-proteobacteria)]|uniref:hypothetical protein n=1 Tax=Paracoccus sp. TaxID=267 RepID=UPI003A899087